MFHMDSSLVKYSWPDLSPNPSPRSVAGSGRSILPLSAAVPSTGNDVTRVCQIIKTQMSRAFLIRFLWPTWHLSLKPKVLSLSKLEPCPSSRCHKGTLLVHLLTCWVSFPRVVQTKKLTCCHCWRQPMLVLHWRRHGKQGAFQLWRHPFPKHLTSTFKGRLVWNHSNSCGRNLGSRTPVWEEVGWLCRRCMYCVSDTTWFQRV